MKSRHLIFATLALSAWAGCLSAEPTELDTDEPPEPVLVASTTQQIIDPLPTTAGRHDLRFSLASGLQRSYILHLPTGYSPARSTPYPIVFVFHGGVGTQSASSFYGRPGIQRLRTLANTQGKILVFPNAALGQVTSDAATWDETMPVKDDVPFAEQLLDHVVGGLNADSDRVYIAGFSHGGHFGQVISGRNHTDIRATGVVAGYWDGYLARPAPPVPFGVYMPVMAVHGAADPTVAFAASTEIYDEWYDANNCTLPSVILALPGQTAIPMTTSCRTGTTHTMLKRVSVVGLGHEWPVAASGYDASAGLLSFFDAT